MDLNTGCLCFPKHLCDRRLKIDIWVLGHNYCVWWWQQICSTFGISNWILQICFSCDYWHWKYVASMMMHEKLNWEIEMQNPWKRLIYLSPILHAKLWKKLQKNLFLNERNISFRAQDGPEPRRKCIWKKQVSPVCRSYLPFSGANICKLTMTKCRTAFLITRLFSHCDISIKASVCKWNSEETFRTIKEKKKEMQFSLP